MQPHTPDTCLSLHLNMSHIGHAANILRDSSSTSALKSSFEYRLPYDDEELNLTSHNGVTNRRNGVTQQKGNSRGQPCTYQAHIVQNIYFAKNMAEQRELLKRQYGHIGPRRAQRDLTARKLAIQNVLVNGDDTELEAVTRRTGWDDDVIAPLWDESVFQVQTGDILFLWVP